jgi:hypothetical protein
MAPRCLRWPRGPKAGFRSEGVVPCAAEVANTDVCKLLEQVGRAMTARSALTTAVAPTVRLRINGETHQSQRAHPCGVCTQTMCSASAMHVIDALTYRALR